MTKPDRHSYPIHGRIDGPVVMIGMGSIGTGVLPLIKRHIDFDRSALTVIDPDPAVADFLDGTGL